MKPNAAAIALLTALRSGTTRIILTVERLPFGTVYTAGPKRVTVGPEGGSWLSFHSAGGWTSRDVVHAEAVRAAAALIATALGA